MIRPPYRIPLIVALTAGCALAGATSARAQDGALTLGETVIVVPSQEITVGEILLPPDGTGGLLIGAGTQPVTISPAPIADSPAPVMGPTAPAPTGPIVGGADIWGPIFGSGSSD
ncbi:MAG: hypothetical protein KC442_17255 [Thermomicrobiales bacterium]|nr:hypothetical protein [Thermomicrobiales bacterium]